MGYNLKNAWNEKSVSKWSHLRPLGFESKFIPQSEFLEKLEDLNYVWQMLLEISKALLSNNFCTNLFVRKIYCHKISLFNVGGLKLGQFDIFDMLFRFLAFVKLL